MRSVKRLVYALVAVLCLVPGLARGYQKLNWRSDLKPAASFRDVDRPPDPASATLDCLPAVGEGEPPRIELGLVKPFAPLLRRAVRRSDRHTLRPPPTATLRRS